MGTVKIWYNEKNTEGYVGGAIKVSNKKKYIKIISINDEGQKEETVIFKSAIYGYKYIKG